MLIHDKKHALMSILSKKSKDGSVSASPMKSEITKEEDGSLDGRHSAAEDIMSAIHEKSAHKLMEAMANFHDLHSAHKEDEEESEEE